MLPFLQKFASSYGYAEGTKTYVHMRLHSDATNLEVLTITPDHTTSRGVISESALQAMKDKNAPDAATDAWLTEIQTAVCGNKARVSSSMVDLTINEQTLSFPIESAAEVQGENIILESLLQAVRIRLRPRDFDRQLEELSGRENEVRLTALELEREQRSLQETIQRNQEQHEVNSKRVASLDEELNALIKQRRAEGADIIEIEEDEELAACRIRVPIINDCKDYEPDMLRMVKSKFVTDDKGVMEYEPRWCSVIRPMTSSELEQFTSSLGMSQKGIIWDCLRKVDEWDYDVFAIQSALTGDDYASLAHQPNGGSLFLTTYALLLRHGSMQKFNLEEQIVLNFLSVIEAGYNPNPYHNSMHAADVLHITHYILGSGGCIPICKLSEEDVLAALIASAIHDYNHPGINNSFHCKAGTYLAYLYNDRSILENIHVSSVFELMKLPRFNLLSNMTEDQRRDIRETVVEMVLATDMGLHAKILGQFRRRLQENHDLTKKDDVRLALSMAVKLADISNCGRPERLYLKWCAKIADEFYMQGDRERNFGLACSPFMDRLQPAMAKGQIAFMNYIVIPLFESISELLPDMHFSVDYAENNKNYWSCNDDTDRN